MKRFYWPKKLNAHESLRTVDSAARWFGAGMLNLVLPPHCFHCERLLPASHSSRFCTDCRPKLAPLVWEGCSRCGASITENDRREVGCSHCCETKLSFDATITLGSYDGLLRGLVLKTKRLESDAAALATADLLVEHRRKELDALECNFVVPIPMYWSRRLWRGVNGADLIAARIAGKLARPLRHALVRHRYTSPQKDLPPRERFKNVRGAFRMNRRNPLQWKAARVLLVDDILTTGATCSEAARVLKEAGASSVFVAVIARAQGAQK